MLVTPFLFLLSLATAVSAAGSLVDDKQISSVVAQKSKLLSEAGYTSQSWDTASIISSINSWASHQPTSLSPNPSQISGELAAESTWYRNFPPSAVKVIQTVFIATTVRNNDWETMANLLEEIMWSTTITSQYTKLPKDVQAEVTKAGSAYVASMTAMNFQPTPVPSSARAPQSRSSSLFAAAVAVGAVIAWGVAF
ncbi:MAG: hypothetical protein M1839_004258 [Geoglossum umbratile]|nr:MAG: hypothetical protein M1839_004258 [Geoglossum umbratile]